mmetsp:Transcript_97937/g.280150  ORF Transcript_97937/g.280150 Transcript_97937/m.280150 type:complete len:137 (-) Transcript_97937:779-1189(-)
MQPQSGQTAPPFPVPAFLKRLSIRPLFPYISNLVIADKERRKGYAKRLVRACEQQARGWGYDRCYLHVDLDYPVGEINTMHYLPRLLAAAIAAAPARARTPLCASARPDPHSTQPSLLPRCTRAWGMGWLEKTPAG